MTVTDYAALPPVIKEKVKILLIDDNPHDRLRLERELAVCFPSLAVKSVRSAKELDVALAAGGYDIAITDFELRWTNGTNVLRQLKASWPALPVIMFTASGTEEVAVEAMKEGLDDYITKKEKHFARVPYAVKASLERATHRRAFETTSISLRESEARFRHMAETMPQILYWTDVDGNVQYTNDRWRSYTGFAGHSPDVLDRIIPPEDREMVFTRWTECRVAGTSFEAEFRMRRKSDGTLRWFLTRALPVRGEDQELQGWIGTMTDIHDQKSAAEESKNADRRKDKFLATLAHELRNPLASIFNAVRFMRLQNTIDPDLQNARDIIDRQAQHLVRLVDDLLDVSRLTLDKVVLHKERVSLKNVISTALDATRPVQEAMHHRLTLSGESEPIYVHADITRLCQVFTNLLNNAIKYTPSGGCISVRVAREDGNALIIFSDDGIGIPPDMLTHIFDLFTQINRADGSNDGLGIGLTLARQLIEMHDGTLTAHSNGTGQGSEFTVRIPIHEATAFSVSSSALNEQAGDGRLLGRRVLVVDDNRDAADSLAMLLGLWGCDVCKAYDGLQAIETAQRFLPEAILLDIGMPDIDGHEICRRIRHEGWAKGIFIIALTGWGQEADRQRTKETGFDAHLVKPIQSDSVAEMLANLMGSGEI
ncbi:MAG TPA: response regulator [Steroidobacteraceae bacterium]